MVFSSYSTYQGFQIDRTVSGWSTQCHFSPSNVNMVPPVTPLAVSVVSECSGRQWVQGNEWGDSESAGWQDWIGIATVSRDNSKDPGRPRQRVCCGITVSGEKESGRKYFCIQLELISHSAQGGVFSEHLSSLCVYVCVCEHVYCLPRCMEEYILLSSLLAEVYLNCKGKMFD